MNLSLKLLPNIVKPRAVEEAMGSIVGRCSTPAAGARNRMSKAPEVGSRNIVAAEELGEQSHLRPRETPCPLHIPGEAWHEGVEIPASLGEVPLSGSLGKVVTGNLRLQSRLAQGDLAHIHGGPGVGRSFCCLINKIILEEPCVARRPPNAKLIGTALQGVNSLPGRNCQRGTPPKPPEAQESRLRIRDKSNAGEMAKSLCLLAAQSYGHKLRLSARMGAIKVGGEAGTIASGPRE